MKPFLFSLLFFSIIGFSLLRAEEAVPTAGQEVQIIDNSSETLQESRFLFKGFKIFVPLQSNTKSKAPFGWRTLELFQGSKTRKDNFVITKFSYRELEGDLLCWCELRYPGYGEESYDPILMRLSGKDLKPLWVKDGRFNMESYLFASGFLYVAGPINFIGKINLKNGEYAWLHEKDPFSGNSGTFRRTLLMNGVVSIQDDYKRILTLDDDTGRILKRDYSLVPRNPVPADQILLGAGFGSYTTYEMFQDHVDGLAWLNGGSWALGMLFTALDPPRQDQSSRSSTSYLSIPGLCLSASYPVIATIVGYSNNNNDVAVRGCIGVGVETVFFILWADAKDNEEASKISLRPDFFPRYAGFTLSQSF